jgi:hypothetical protein
MGDACDPIDAVLRHVATLSSAPGGGGGGPGDPLGLRGDDVCFDVATRLERGCWILVGWCRLTVSIPSVKAPMVPSLETII